MPLTAGFLALAAWMWLAPPGFDLDIPEPAHVEPAQLAVGPVRQALDDPASIDLGGFRQSCNGCHQIFTAVPREPHERSFHGEIVLNHGMNNRCANCHDAGNFERLRLHDGTSIPYARVATLCAQCHGTVFRDWERGAHGKTLGAWSPAMGEMMRLRCSECHNPHAPAFPRYEPLPGPRTLRMGIQPAEPPHDDRHRPLRRLLAPHAKPGATGVHP
jgi:hypothetical protein